MGLERGGTVVGVGGVGGESGDAGLVSTTFFQLFCL